MQSCAAKKKLSCELDIGLILGYRLIVLKAIGARYRNQKERRWILLHLRSPSG
jgi:hypothetical protein